MLLSAAESNKLLSQAGINTVDTELVVSTEEAICKSEQMGFPVALKIASPDILHKSDVGGVKLGLKTSKQVAKAYGQILKSVSLTHPEAVIQGVLVQEMARPGIEVIIGAYQDVQFGPVVMFGLGGIWVEVMKDVTFGVIPITKRDAVRMIEGINGYPVLTGCRGQQPVGVSYLKELLLKVSSLMEHNPKVKELDLNPIFAYSDGAMAIDVKIMIEEHEAYKKPKHGSARESLAQIFSPHAVAVVGISPMSQISSFARQAVENLKRARFPAIYPVNPKYTEVLGLPCYPNVRSITGEVDHVIVSVPVESAMTVLDDCIAKGVKSVHFFTAGFGETEESKQIEMENTMLKKAREGGIRIIGPNSVGLLATKNRLVTRSVMPMSPGSIAFLSQSGGFFDDLPLLGGPRGLRFSKLISYGNALDVNESEIIEYFSGDTDVEIIAAYIEGVKDGRCFFDALKMATARKPVVVLKGGITEAGQRATRSHTASLANPVAVFSALCQQLNVIQVDDMEELTDILVMLSFLRPYPRGNGVAIVGTGGGPSVWASDEAEKSGLHVVSLPTEVESELRHFLPFAGSIVANPVDATNLTSPEVIYTTLNILGRFSNINTFIYHMGFHPLSRWGDGRFSSPDYLRDIVNALEEAKKTTGRPVVLALYPPLDLVGMKDFLKARRAFVEAGLPVFHSLRQVSKALTRLIAWHQYR